MHENKVRITWYGTASVRIATNSSQLLIDPFIPFPDSRVNVPSDAFDGCSHIIISHGHFDHIGSIPEIVRRHTAVYCTKAPYRTLIRKGVDKTNLHMIKESTCFSIGDIHITAYKGKHISLGIPEILKVLFSKRFLKNRKDIVRKLIRFASCLEKKETLCYRIKAYDKQILILGSLALADGILYPTGVDLALFPYQGSDKLCDMAMTVYDRIRPKAVLLTHFDDTFPPFSSDIDTSGFEKRMKNTVPVYKLHHGGSLEI
ncbi:MBL fold metallo-hydrolase [Ruminococcus sp.]|uniref:MBL fold metallo-hydrolase n=1 Tax=Ruminococcus sp. TaxID=41978 RepID=UPI0025F39662|nr:MBL fold metallo-hydrolase [Ruminococcus sp.]MCR4638344.1 MBL fold metallo-hydrolase [Ruminococcus sp.]